MKNWKFTLYMSAIMIAFSSILTINTAKAQVYGQVSLDLFYDELSPYGNWDMDPNYGDIWYPNEGRNFRPYSSNGYWTMTEYGNTWVSNYDWGWAPFHYGRWVYNSYRGWGWIPGYEWGPAWVEWRSGNGYYGWAPMMPRVGVSIGINIPVSAWCFAPVRYIYSPTFHRHAYYGRSNIYNRTTIIHNTYVVNNHHYYGGPARRDIERAIGRRVEVRSIRQSDRPGRSQVDSRNVSIYRPDRDNNRTTSRSATSDRRTTNTNREATRKDNRVDNNRSAARNAQREMHIGNDGKTTIRNRETKTEERAVTNRNNSTVTPQRNSTSRNTESVNRNAERNNRTIERSTVDRSNENARNRNIENSRGNNAQPQRVERSVPQRVERAQPQRVEQAQPQRQERTQPQREQRTQERSVRNTNPVFQTSNSRGAQSSNSNVTRSSSSPRVERSAPASSNRSTGNAQRGGGNSGSERSRR